MFKPMLAPNNDPMKDSEFFRGLRFPLYCSPKLDGIRCITSAGSCFSRSFKTIPNHQIQDLFSSWEGLDGELILGDETDFDVYNRTQSHVMSFFTRSEKIRFRVFDSISLDLAKEPFRDRLEHARILIEEYEEILGVGRVSLVTHTLCETLEDLLEYEASQLALGYEGIMMRDPLGIYKHGRGTFREGLIYKLKRFQDDEGVITGFIEQTTNTNIQTRDVLGRAERSTAKAGLAQAGTLGKLLVDFQGDEISVALGCLTHPQRLHIWENQNTFLGKMIKFRHFPHGVKTLPRFPRVVGFREDIDL